MNAKLIDFKSKTKPLTIGNYYWTFEKALDSKTCNLILDTASNHFSKVEMMNQDGKSEIDEQMRKGQSLFNNQQFVYDIIWPYLNTANKNAEWNFEISSAESYQIGKYEVGDFYDKHIDGLGTEGTKIIDPSRKNLHNKTRKLSVSVNLNNDYEGGDLILYHVGPVKQKTGNITFFPSYLPHEVTPVTKGTRYSLVMWFLGNPWR
jgi:PKHD-type hydroxylase|tara:strand:- start:1 stop:615 length:615 start_codon:yes stop_codon:yes gene_type:complete